MKEESSFRKSLNLFDSTAIVMGSMIGSGVFIVGADIARQVGSPGWLLMTWVITGFLTVFAALSYGELAGMFPHAGGQYVYLRKAYNPLIGFLYGWTLFLVIQTGTIAAVGMAFAKFTGVLFPGVSEHIIWYKAEIHHYMFKFGPVQIVAILSILLLTWINLKGVKEGKKVQNIFTSGKVILVLGFILLGFFIASNPAAISKNLSYFWEPATKTASGQWIPLTGMTLIAALGMAQVGSLFSSDAWNNITFTAGEVINPRKNIPMSLFLGTFIVTIMFILTNVVYIMVIPLRGDASGLTVMERGIQYALNDRLATAAVHNVFGMYAAVMMAVLIMISTFGCNNGLILSGARVYYAMAADGLFFKKVGSLNAKGVPATGLIIQAVWASLLCISGTYGQLLDYVVFAVLIFYVLTIAGLFILRVKMPDAERPYRAFGYPVVPALYIILATCIMLILLFYKRDYTWPGLVVVILGIPVYYLWNRKPAHHNGKAV